MPEAAVADKGAAPAADAGAQSPAPADKTPLAADKAPAPAAAKQDAAAAPKGNGEDKAGAWPQDWVTRMSKGDEKIAKQFSRYASPEALAEAHISLRRRLDSGEFKTVLPKDAKPDEITAWRKDNGIPEKPEAYDLKGIEVPEGDQEIIGNFLKNAHAANFTPEQTKVAVKGYYDELNRQTEAREQLDEQQRTQVLDALNQEYGAQFRRNVNLIEGTVLSRFPESVREALRSARLPDGTALFNNVDAVRAFVALALEMNPAGIVAPGGTGDLGKSAMSEYKELQKFMRENRSEYNKDTAKQARFTELIDYLSKNELIDGQGNEVVQRKRAA